MVNHFLITLDLVKPFLIIASYSDWNDDEKLKTVLRSLVARNFKRKELLDFVS